MADYDQYSDRHIRNKDSLSDEEQALADIQAKEEVSKFLARFKGERSFLKKFVGPKLVNELTSIYND